MYLKLVGHRPLLSSQRLLTHEAAGELVIDASDMGFVSPLDLTAMTALAHAHAARGDRVQLRMPKDPSVASYVERMDLLNQLPDQCRIDRPVRPRGRIDRSKSLVEITPVTGTATGAAVSARVFDVARANLNDLLGVITFKVVGELIDNAASHGRSDIGSFVAAQIYPAKKRLEFAVCDTGIGVLAHLTSNPAHQDVHRDDQALSRAMEWGASGELDDRGVGLPTLMKIAGGAGNARLVIRSGRGQMSASSGTRGPLIRSVSAPDPIDGTWAWLRVRFT